MARRRRPQATSEDVRNIRRQLGWSQQDLARYLGADVATISRWETEAVRISPFYARALKRLIESAELKHKEPWRFAEWRDRRRVAKLKRQLKKIIVAARENDATALARLAALSVLMDTWVPWTDADWEEIARKDEDEETS